MPPYRPPKSTDTSAARIGASPLTMIARGARKHCVVCNQGHLYKGWFTMKKVCPGCGLRFEREQGFFVGQVGLNTIISGGALLIVIGIATVMTQPDVPMVELMILGVATVIITALLSYPFSRTIWLALDLMLGPLADDEAPNFSRETHKLIDPTGYHPAENATQKSNSGSEE